MISAVLLDVGGVLVMPSHELVGAIAATHGAPMPAAAVLERGHYEGVAAGERPGGFDWSDYRRALLRCARVPAEQLEPAQAELGHGMAGPANTVWCHVLTGAVDGLERLRSAGVPVGIVSNADGTVAQLLVEVGLAQLGQGLGLSVSVLVDSEVVGVAKPHPGIFHLALDALGVEPSAAVHVGDTINADVDGARRAGVRPLHLDPIGWCGDRTHEHVRSLGGTAELLLT